MQNEIRQVFLGLCSYRDPQRSYSSTPLVQDGRKEAGEVQWLVQGQQLENHRAGTSTPGVWIPALLGGAVWTLKMKGELETETPASCSPLSLFLLSLFFWGILNISTSKLCRALGQSFLSSCPDSLTQGHHAVSRDFLYQTYIFIIPISLHFDVTSEIIWRS